VADFQNLPIYDEKDVYLASDISRWQALEIGFDKSEASLLAVATSEICMNALRHAHGGRASVNVSKNGKGVEVVIRDNGLGIDDLDIAFEDGFSTTQTLGLGLGVARRSVDEMHIANHSNGCSVTLRKFLPIDQRVIETAVLSFPKVGSDTNGDSYLIKSYEGDKLVAAIFDGTGSGSKAAKASSLAKKHFIENIASPFPEVVKSLHARLIAEGAGRAVELAAVRVTEEYIESVIIGNTRTIFIQGDIEKPILNNGALGHSYPAQLATTISTYSKPTSFLLCSDGIRPFPQAELEGTNKSAKSIATDLFDRFSLAEDDASIIVVKVKAHERLSATNGST